MGNPAFQNQAHELFGRRGHIPEALSEGDYRESHLLQVLRHLGRSPPVICDLGDVVDLPQVLDLLFDVPVVDDIAFRHFHQAHLHPGVIRHMVAFYPQVHRLFRDPEERQNQILPFVRIIRREDQDQGCNIRCAREVEPCVAFAPQQALLHQLHLIYFPVAFVPFLHGHPADGLLDPLVQAQLAEGILLGRVLLRAFAGVPDGLFPDCDAQGRIRLIPDLRIGPVIIPVSSIDDRVECRVMFTAFQDVDRFLVLFPADALLVISCCRDQEEQRLCPGVAGALGHDVEQLPVRLCVQLVEDYSGDVQPVFCGYFRRQNLIEAVGRLEQDPVRGLDDLAALHQGRAELDHVHSHIEDDLSLQAVSCTSINLCPLLSVCAEQKERDRCRELTLSLFLRYLDVGRVELAVSVRFQGPEDVPDDPLLPLQELERLVVPQPLGVPERPDKGYGKISGRLVVM